MEYRHMASSGCRRWHTLSHAPPLHVWNSKNAAYVYPNTPSWLIMTRDDIANDIPHGRLRRKCLPVFLETRETRSSRCILFVQHYNSSMAELNGGKVDIHMSHDGSFVYVLVCPNTKINEAESDTRRKRKRKKKETIENAFEHTGSKLAVATKPVSIRYVQLDQLRIG